MVREFGHAGESGDQNPERGGEPADQDGPPAPPLQVVAGSIEVLVQMVLHEREVADRSPQDVMPPPLADQIPDRVADDRPRHGGHDGRRQADAMLEGEDPAKKDGDLSRKDESDERRRLQGGHGEHDRQGDPAV